MIFAPKRGGMNNTGLDRLIRKIGANVSGEPGYWQFDAHDCDMLCITDEVHDRMRVMTPVATVSELSPEQVVACLEANFDRALDARYCLREGVLWGAFIHPLNALTDELFESAVRQVAGVRKNFGDSYSSGELVFQG